MNVERRGREGPYRRGHRRPERQIQVAETEHLHLKRVAGNAWIVQACGEGDALPFFVHEDRVENRIQVRETIAVIVLETAVVNLDTAGRAGRQIGEDQPFALGLLETDPTIAVGVGHRQRLQTHLQADHFHQAAAEHVRRVVPGAAVLGHRLAGAGVAVGNVMARSAGTGVTAVHHLGGSVG